MSKVESGSMAVGPNARAKDIGWVRFTEQVQLDVRLFALCVAAMQLFRVILIAVFHEQMSPGSTLGDIISVLLNGLRYDLRVAACFVAPGFLASVACLFGDFAAAARGIRYAAAAVFIAATIVLTGIDIGYFDEFHNQFDHYLMDVLFDDMGAVLWTVWKEYPVVWVALGMTAGTLLGVWATVRFLARPWVDGWTLAARTKPQAVRIAVLVALSLMMIASARGSIGSRPVQLKDAAVTADPFLNKTVIDPYSAIQYALTGYFKLTSSDGLTEYVPDGDIADAARVVAGSDQTPADLDATLRRTAKGPKGTPPRHIFLIVMESYDAWPTLPQYESLQLTPQIKRLGEQGILVRDFLPASTGTMTSLAAIMTGLVDVGVATNYQPRSQKPYPSSIAPIFRKLGYRTRIFYGGYLSWQRLEDFCREQGVEEIYGGGHITRHRPAHTNEWGVDDEALFQFVAESVNDDEPSFNIILSTTYHAPYDIDVHAKGYPVRAVPPELQGVYTDTSITLEMLGHLWYADHWMGRFVEEICRTLPNTVCAVTGDHWSREFIGSRPTLYERSAVPLLLYGPDVLKGIERPSPMAGSHLDIAPTLIELAAPSGFEYHALGGDLLDAARPPIGFGRGRVIGPGFILDTQQRESIEPTNHSGAATDLPTPQREAALRRRHNAMLAVAWWRIMRGEQLPAPSPVPDGLPDAP